MQHGTARGHRSAAAFYRNAYELLENLPGREKSILLPVMRRRKAQVQRSTKDAARASEIAETRYSEDTSNVIQGILLVSELEFDCATRVLAALQERQGPMSWLYEFERLYLQALIENFTKRWITEEIYALLVQAQYILATLNLQPSIPHHLQLNSPPGYVPHGWTPCDILRSVLDNSSAGRTLGKKECLGLRKVVIGEELLLEQLTNPLCGDGDSPLPPSGYSKRYWRENPDSSKE